MTPIRLEIFSDYTCPWCYVGWARLEKALERLPSDISVEVEWRPFEIHPEVPQEGMPVEELGYPADVWARMQECAPGERGSRGAGGGKSSEGLEHAPRPPGRGMGSSSSNRGAFPAFHERLFVGYFAEGRDLGDPAVVDDLAASAGIDVEAMRMAIDRGAWAAALAQTTADARAMGITGAPTFVFDRRFATSGAQPVDVLLRAFEAAAEVSTPRPPT